MIGNDNHITLLGINRNERKFDDLAEFVIFSAINTMTQAKRGCYDGNIEYLAEWVYGCTNTVRDRLRKLIAKGYITAIQRPGKSTIYQVVPLDPCKSCTPAKSAPLQNMVEDPCKSCTPDLKHIHIKEENKNTTTTTTRAKLQTWFEGTDLAEWVQRLCLQKQVTVDIDNLLNEFYDNDLLVRERCERGERSEVLGHFQRWLPKYLTAITKERNPDDNNARHKSVSHRPSNTLDPSKFVYME